MLGVRFKVFSVIGYKFVLCRKGPAHKTSLFFLAGSSFVYIYFYLMFIFRCVICMFSTYL